MSVPRREDPRILKQYREWASPMPSVVVLDAALGQTISTSTCGCKRTRRATTTRPGAPTGQKGRGPGSDGSADGTSGGACFSASPSPWRTESLTAFCLVS